MARRPGEKQVNEVLSALIPMHGIYRIDLLQRMDGHGYERGEVEAALLQLTAEGRIKPAGCEIRPMYVKLHKLSIESKRMATHPVEKHRSTGKADHSLPG